MNKIILTVLIVLLTTANLSAQCSDSQLSDYRNCVDAAVGTSVCNTNSCDVGDAAASYNSELNDVVQKCCDKKKASKCFKANSRAYSQASKKLRKTNQAAEDLTRALAQTLRDYKRDAKTICGAYPQLF